MGSSPSKPRKRYRKGHQRLMDDDCMDIGASSSPHVLMNDRRKSSYVPIDGHPFYEQRGSSIDLSTIQNERRKYSMEKSNANLSPRRVFDGRATPANTPAPSVHTVRSKTSTFSVKFPSGGSLHRRLAAIAGNATLGRGRRSRTSPFGTSASTTAGWMSPAETLYSGDADFMSIMSMPTDRRGGDMDVKVPVARLPRVDSEADALDRLHYLLQYTFEGKYHHVPKGHGSPPASKGSTCPVEGTFEFSRVLDVSCGTGIWTLELAQKYARVEPPIQVDAVDARQIHPEMIHPDRVQFHVFGNGKKKKCLDQMTLPFPADRFDFTRCGLDPSAWLSGYDCGLGVSGETALEFWHKRLHEMARVTKPGGWMEVVVSDWKLYATDGVRHEASDRVTAWIQHVLGIPSVEDDSVTLDPPSSRMSSLIKKELENVGCESVSITTYLIPIGTPIQPDAENNKPGRILWQPASESVAIWQSILTALAQRHMLRMHHESPSKVVEQWDDFATMLQDWESELSHSMVIQEGDISHESMLRWWQVDVVTGRAS